MMKFDGDDVIAECDRDANEENEKVGSFKQFENGYEFEPNSNMETWTFYAADLRQIADKLDELNA